MPAHSNLNGQLCLLDCAVTLPPERESEISHVSTIAVTFKDDTTRFVDSPQKQQRINTQVSKETAAGIARAADESFLDHIDYDLVIANARATQRCVSSSTRKRAKNFLLDLSANGQ